MLCALHANVRHGKYWWRHLFGLESDTLHRPGRQGLGKMVRLMDLHGSSPSSKAVVSGVSSRLHNVRECEGLTALRRVFSKNTVTMRPVHVGER